MTPPGFGSLVFRRQPEPREGAFTLLVPDGWHLQGGIVRADLMHQVVDAQAIAAKIDLAVMRDTQGSVMMRWCPEVKYCDMRYNMAGAMFPPGSNYGGMVVAPLISACDFLARVCFPWAHPQATHARILEQRRVPELIEAFRNSRLGRLAPMQGDWDAGVVTFAYREGGVEYEEMAYTLISSLGPMAGGMWSNVNTAYSRAPRGELAAWEPVLARVRDSAEFNPLWLVQEIVNQQVLAQSFLNAQRAQQWREQRMLQVQQQIQQIDQEIAAHTAQTQASIQHQEYLNLMGQEEYWNPYTERVETGSNQWAHRWTNANGDVFYTDLETDDPNLDVRLNAVDWRRTIVRRR